MLTLFYGEKLKDVLRLGVGLVWAETGNILQSATLYTLFSESKKRQKIFAAQTPQRKRGYVEDFAQSITFSHLYYPYKRDRLATTVRPCNLWQNRRATGARIWGSVRSRTISAKVLFLIYSNSQQDLLLRPARLREMTTAECYIYVWLDKKVQV